MPRPISISLTRPGYPETRRAPDRTRWITGCSSAPPRSARCRAGATPAGWPG
ncbi:hypothetical protein [Ornithinimicrobium kibberense]|uniref:hypothetical protein n=1 Tax=Ornithinimicrobium kibberense TaxID=282060 RepID=UPI00361CB19B